MLALTLVAVCSIYVIGVRADRVHADRVASGTVTEPGIKDGAGASPHIQRATSGSAESTAPGSATVPRGLYRGHTAEHWAARFRMRTRQLQVARGENRKAWAPTVTYALRLAGVVYGVPVSQLADVAYCESRHNPLARNGQYRGLFQEGPMFERGPFSSFSVWDPVANALTAAWTVAREGWGQWACKPRLG